MLRALKRSIKECDRRSSSWKNSRFHVIFFFNILVLHFATTILVTFFLFSTMCSFGISHNSGFFSARVWPDKVDWAGGHVRLEDVIAAVLKGLRVVHKHRSLENSLRNSPEKTIIIIVCDENTSILLKCPKRTKTLFQKIPKLGIPLLIKVG